MDLARVTVDLDTLRKMGELLHDMRDKGTELLNSNTNEQRAAGSQVWGLADTMGALIRNCVLPFGIDDKECAPSGLHH